MLLGIAFSQYADIEDIFFDEDQKIILQTRRYEFEKYPGAFNPSIHRIDKGYILSFRYCPDEASQSWLSYIGIVRLDESLNPIEMPKLLATRPRRSKTPSQAEDARIFSFKDRLYLIYNDNVDDIFFHYGLRRDMFMAELIPTEEGYKLSSAIKLTHDDNYNKIVHQKNWIPFDWNGELHISYSMCPHEILIPSFRNGVCSPKYITEFINEWEYGKLRGSTPPVLIDGQFLAFFHSGVKLRSPATNNWKAWHYFMGAYTFSDQPPFQITQISKKPIMHPSFYTSSNRDKRVVFPGGFVFAGPNIHVAYGKDDCEMWIATLDKKALLKSLIPLDNQTILHP